MTTTTPTAGPAPAAQVWPLTPLQSGLLYHAVSGEGGLDVYSMQSTYAFRPGTDLAVLHRACTSLLERHDALRAGFSAALLDRPVQFVPASVVTPWRELDLSEMPGPERLAALAALEVAERQRRFDMDAPPLIRFVGVDLGDDGVRLVVTNHHILMDGWSDALVVVELLQHIAAGGRDDALPTPPALSTYLAWLGARDGAADLAAWARALSGLEAGSTLAEVDPSREAVFPETLEVELGADLTAAVSRLARTCAVSSSTVYSTVWGVLLRSLLGRDDVVFGTTVSGRPADIEGVDEMVGLFLNTVPHRVTIRPHESVRALLGRVQAEQSALVEHHHVRLGDIQREAGVGPLFDSLYVMRNTPTDDDALADLSERVGLEEIDGGDSTHYPATFIVHPDRSTRLILAYRPDVVDGPRAQALLDAAVRVLGQMAAEPDAAVGTLDVLDPAAEQALVASWAGERRPLQDTSLVQLLEQTARRVPERTAVVDEHTRLTFAELWGAVCAQARALREQGVGPGDLVTVELPRGCGVVVAIFAVLAARAAYVPIDESTPDARREAIRAASGARVHLTADTALPVRGHLTDEGSGIDGAGYHHEDLAYVMFTSGSTGAPKGVAVEHTGLVNMLANHRRRIFAPAGAGPDRQWRVAHSVSFAFDMSWEELLWLLDGHEVHLLSETVRRDPAAMTGYLDEHAIDVINVTPSVAGALLADGLLDEGTHTPRLVLLGGEAVGPDVWAALRDSPRTHGYNLYGPTEYTINTLGGGTQDSRTPIVGTAIENTDVRVLDSALRPVPDGVPGELYVTGAGLARGYQGAPALTAERFVADPFGEPGTRMYRTGDVVSRRPDGVFDFHGRSDSQVKIRGHRVEPGEVQAVLATDPRVARCAVVARRMPTGALALVGYVVPARGTRLDDATRADLVSGLAARLPEAMVPSALVEVADLPLTVNSKLDVARLPLPELGSGGGRRPRGPQEETVCAVFAEVLGLDQVGVDDNFFALGGHSLVAMRAASLLSARLGRRLGVATLLTAPTPAGIVASLDGEHDPFAVVLPLGGRPGRGQAPLLCVHPMLGLGWTFSSIASRLDGRAAWALQSPALRETDVAVADLDRMAARLVDDADLACRTSGDDLAATGVHLLGWSYGAHLAHAVCAVLEARGIEVHSLTLLDPGPPAWAPEPAEEPADGEPAAVAGAGTDDADPDDLQEVLSFLLAASLREVPEDLVAPYDPADVLDFLADGTGAFAGLGRADLDALARARSLGAELLPTARDHHVQAPTTLVVSGTPDRAHTQAWRQVCEGGLEEVALDIPHDLLTSPYAAERIAPLVLAHVHDQETAR